MLYKAKNQQENNMVLKGWTWVSFVMFSLVVKFTHHCIAIKNKCLSRNISTIAYIIQMTSLWYVSQIAALKSKNSKSLKSW